MGEFEPGTCKGICQFFWVFQEALRYWAIERVHAQGEVCGEHDGLVALLGVVCIWDHLASRGICGDPLPCTCRALFEIPIILE